jgi:hypothetical protein
MNRQNIMTKEKQSEVHVQNTTVEDGSPKFGRLLIVLLFAVALIVAITFATEAYYGV